MFRLTDLHEYPHNGSMTTSSTAQSQVGLTRLTRGHGGKVYDRGGTRQINPTCELCGKQIRVDEGERWSLVKDTTGKRRWASNTGAAHDECAKGLPDGD